MTQTYDAGTIATNFEHAINRLVAGERQEAVLGVSQPPPRVRISLWREATGEWLTDFSVETFDCDPATDTGYSLIARRLEDVDSLVRQRIKQFTDRDAGGQE